MSKKLIIGLSFLAVLILLYILNINKQNSYKSTSNKIFDFNKNQVDKILIQSQSEAIELLKNDSTWAISGNDSLTIKEELLNRFFDQIFTLESENIMTKNKEKWPVYNVDDSLGTHLALVDLNENTIGYFVFGRSVKDYARCYARIDDKEEVHLLNQNLMYFLQTNPTYWGEVKKEDLPQENL
tara:strand:- start:15 stop:563 length:549 start_codon:yes stop_codon:yes gene_type:complete